MVRNIYSWKFDSKFYYCSGELSKLQKQLIINKIIILKARHGPAWQGEARHGEARQGVWQNYKLPLIENGL